MPDSKRESTIDPFRDELIPALDVPAWIKKNIRGFKKPHGGSVQRWMQTGTRGHLLHSIKLAGVRYTTAECIREFFLAVQSPAAPAAEPKPKQLAHRSRKRAAAKRKLAKAGI